MSFEEIRGGEGNRTILVDGSAAAPGGALLCVGNVLAGVVGEPVPVPTVVFKSLVAQ
jgi:hypothetical protein